MNLDHANAALFAALASAQTEVENATKGSINPHFKSRYADLAEVLNTVRPVFGKHGLAIIQSVQTDGRVVSVTTTLGHKEGGFVSSTTACLAAKEDAQGIGAAATYLRRYGLAAMCGVAQEDDDGNAASGRPVKSAPPPAAVSPVAELGEAAIVAQEGTEALKAWFGGRSETVRKALAAHPEWAGIKAAAGKVQK